MKNVFVITDFGAVGDGKTDCTAAIQSALDAAAGVSGKVVVPPGVYILPAILKCAERVCRLRARLPGASETTVPRF